MCLLPRYPSFFFLNDTATTEIYTLSLHDALPISELFARSIGASTDIVEKEMYTFQDRDGTSLTLRPEATAGVVRAYNEHKDRKSTRLNSSHSQISYAVFCLKKKTTSVTC